MTRIQCFLSRAAVFKRPKVSQAAVQNLPNPPLRERRLYMSHRLQSASLDHVVISVFSGRLSDLHLRAHLPTTLLRDPFSVSKSNASTNCKSSSNIQKALSLASFCIYTHYQFQQVLTSPSPSSLQPTASTHSPI